MIRSAFFLVFKWVYYGFFPDRGAVPMVDNRITVAVVIVYLIIIICKAF